MGRFADWFYGRESADRMATLATPDQPLLESMGVTSTSSAESVSVEGSMRIGDVFSAVDIIAESVQQLPFKVFRKVGDGVEEQPEHRAYRMLHDMPNPFTPAHRFWSTICVHELLWGNWFIEKLRGQDGLVNELRLVHPATVDVMFSEQAGFKRFKVTRADGTQTQPLGPDRILHGFGLSKDGLVGMSRIQQARESLGVSQARKRFEGEVYGQRPYISGVIQHPASIKDNGVKLRESWRAIYGSGGQSRHGVAVLEEGATFTPMTAPLEDMQFVEASKLSKTEIAVLFKIPPAYLGGSTGDSLTYQTVEGNRIQFATQAVAPVANNVAQFVSHDPEIFPFVTWYAEFVLEGLLRGDSVSRADYWNKLNTIVPLDPEYVAARENIPLSAIKEPEPVPAGLQAVPSEPGQIMVADESA